MKIIQPEKVNLTSNNQTQPVENKNERPHIIQENLCLKNSSNFKA